MEQNVQNPELAELAKKLPLKLRQGFRKDVVCKAIEENYIRLTDDGRLEWLIESKTLLAYFCGRMWCGDKGWYSIREDSVMWKTGKGKFPDTDLTVLFGTSGLRQIRNNRKNMPLPEQHKLIDSLFVSSNPVNTL